MKTNPILCGDRIRLYAVEPDDTDLMWSMENDSEQWKLNGMSAPYSRHNIYEYATRYDANPFTAGQLRLMVRGNGERGATSETLGMVDLYEISALNHTAHVGIYVRKESRCQGYALEMLKVLERYAREILNLRSLASRIAADNEVSLRLFARAGYAECGILREWISTPQGGMDMVIMQKLLETV